MRKQTKLPIPVQHALRKIGEDIRDARRRRRIPSQVMSERCGISRTTLVKLEKGNPGVSIGSFATALFVLGLMERLRELVDVRHDEVGLDLVDEWLPQRIHSPKPKRES